MKMLIECIMDEIHIFSWSVSSRQLCSHIITQVTSLIPAAVSGVKLVIKEAGCHIDADLFVPNLRYKGY
jgi:hypothetical protein